MPLSFVATELTSYVVSGVLVFHAFRRRQVGLLVAAMAYGFLLEYNTVRTEADYCYGRFLVMMPPWPAAPEPFCAVGPRVPLWGSLAWGYFIYGAMATSSRLTLPWAVRPLLDGLLVVTFDWVLDPVAERLGFWKWSTPGAFFGIPLDNYFGWFMVVAAFSLVLRAFRRRIPPGSRGPVWDAAVLVATIPCAIVLLAVALEIYVRLAARGVSQPLMLGVTLAAAVLIVVPHWLRAAATAPLDWIIVGSVVFHHGWNGLLLALSGLAVDQPLLVAVWVASLLAALVGYAGNPSMSPTSATG